ncbi:hypothetical protein D3C78_1801310 [compost metagenome]
MITDLVFGYVLVQVFAHDLHRFILSLLPLVPDPPATTPDRAEHTPDPSEHRRLLGRGLDALYPLIGKHALQQREQTIPLLPIGEQPR